MANESLFHLAQKYGPIITLHLGVKTTIVVSSPSMAKEVLKTNDQILAGRTVIDAAKCAPYSESSLVYNPCGPPWRMLRRICSTELFSAKKLEALQHLWKLCKSCDDTTIVVLTPRWRVIMGPYFWARWKRDSFAMLPIWIPTTGQPGGPGGSLPFFLYALKANNNKERPPSIQYKNRGDERLVRSITIYRQTHCRTQQSSTPIAYREREIERCRPLFFGRRLCVLQYLH
eukprot:Gb_21591 [translate_table: standard]